jgi:hypothetical protein
MLPTHSNEAKKFPTPQPGGISIRAVFIGDFIELQRSTDAEFFNGGIEVGFGPQNSGTRSSLWGNNLNQYNKEKERLINQLKNRKSPCAEFLKEKLGLSSTRVAKAVGGMRAFDGGTSTVTMGNAGLLPRSDPNSNLLVGLYFAGGGGKKVDAMTAMFATPDDRGATLRDVYFGDSFDGATILHESLHFFTGMSDKALAKKLGVDISDGDTTKISTALKDGGCGQ